ncbi:MAG TPA: copper amine oxidase N-terminal domain-containing protein, partial [Firmicutes bacterium]|nr:copper amine oxidase N-terminal domain-containing protein [Bacillota bacterium]
MLRKRLAFFCCLLGVALLAALLTSGPARAAGSPIKLVINDQVVQPDAPPVIRNNRTLVPLRVISENLGAEVGWDNKTRTVTVAGPGQGIKLVIGRSDALVNGKAVKLDTPTVILGNRTFVPLRFI